MCVLIIFKCASDEDISVMLKWLDMTHYDVSEVLLRGDLADMPAFDTNRLSGAFRDFLRIDAADDAYTASHALIFTAGADEDEIRDTFDLLRGNGVPRIKRVDIVESKAVVSQCD